MTWSEPSRPLPTVPTQIAIELGLPDFADERVWCAEVPVSATQAIFIPSCFDAELSSAWSPPPPGHVAPWGLTRDLLTGEVRHPEVLVEVRDCINTTGVSVHLIRDPATGHKVGPLTPDYMIGRN
jgi:hypothetical protein